VDSLPITTVDWHWPIDPRAWWRLVGQAAGVRAEIAHTWGGAAGRYGRTAARAAGVRRLVATPPSVDRPWSPLAAALEQRLARKTDALVAPGIAALTECVRRGLPAERLHAIPPCAPRIPPPAVSRERWLAALQLPENARVVVVLGPLDEPLRAKDLIWAFDLMRLARAGSHLVILGDGPQKGALLRFTIDLGAEAVVHFVGSGTQVESWLGHADAAWFLADCREPPAAVLTALAAGVPVVAGDAPGVREAIGCDETVPCGRIVPAHERAAFARATIQLWDDPRRADALRRAGRRRLEAAFGPDAFIARHAELYRSL
jgi:glycosyltransferase involved in cell wall biosynthesis